MPGWVYSGGGDGEYPGYRVIPYGNAETTADAATEVLAYFDAYAYIYRDDDGVPVVCCVRRGQPREAAEFLLPGSQLVTGVDGGWRIEAVARPAVTT
jgi:hypothetical protein